MSRSRSPPCCVRPPAPASPCAEGTMARILVVEDNADLLSILRELLSVEHEVATARRGEEAIEVARTFRPDLVILDLQLPSMDGIEAGRWIKRDRKSTRLNSSHVKISYAVFCLKKKNNRVENF